MLWWIENVWFKRESSNPRSLLILDFFHAHLIDLVKQCLLNHNTNTAVISGRLTSKLQPLDISINKRFKAKIHALYNRWMTETIHKLTSSGCIKQPLYLQLA
ncbi:3176_t:CDS:1, partial [Dentiscutata erythropus]